MSFLLYPRYYINEVLKNMADIVEDARPGVYDKAEKIRPLIRATGEDIPVGKVMPTSGKARKRLYQLWTMPGKQAWWTELEKEQFKTDMYTLSLVEMCVKYNRNIRGVLNKAALLGIRQDYPLKDGRALWNRGEYKNLNGELIEACYTKTLYGLGLVTQKTMMGVIGALDHYFKLAAQKKEEVSAPAKTRELGKRAVVGIPELLRFDFEQWIEREGVTLYLKSVEETLKQRRRQ